MLDLYSTHRLGAGTQCMLFHRAGASQPALYTEDAPPEREEGKTKRPIFVCVVLTFSCMLMLAGVGE